MWLSVLCWSSLFLFCAAQTSKDLAMIDTTNLAVQQYILDLINECRRTVNPSATNMLEAVWSTEAAETAKKSSERCKFEHVDREQRKISECYCGENLYRNTASPNWTLAITAFCDEQKFFTYAGEKKDPKEETGHYTQTVWYLSAKVGCHCTYCGGTWMYACHQCPAGNVAPVNIPYESGSSCGQCPNNCRNKLCTNPCTKYNIVTKGNCETYKKRNLCNMDAMKQQCAASCNCEKEIY